MARGRNAKALALEALVEATVALFHRLTAASEELHGLGALSGGQRGILRGLDRLGLQTVPQMARARPVSRQHIQAVVNLLRARGLVELVPNPAHRRSPLVAMTSRGQRVLKTMTAREERALGRLRGTIRPGEATRAAGVLRRVRETLEDPGWSGPGRRGPGATAPGRKR